MIKRIISIPFKKKGADKFLRKSIKNITGLNLKNPDLYERALTHSNQKKSKTSSSTDYERLEFLGDSVLGAIVSEIIYKKFPKRSEGFLTKLRSRIVSRQHLNTLAKKIGIQEIIISDLEKREIESTNIGGNALEALIGAIYIDQGFLKSRDFIYNKLIRYHIDIDKLAETDEDYKSQLQIFCQRRKLELRYESEELPERTKEGRKLYRIMAFINNRQLEEFEHKNKKIGEQRLAQLLLDKINNGEIRFT